MTTPELVLLIVAVVVILAIVALVGMKQRKSRMLREQFGPEYDRTIDRSDKRREAERELTDRAERREQLDIRPLPREHREAYAERWRETQQEFVDSPSMAVRRADLLVAEVMGRRGYPVGDFDEQADLVSVDHSQVVDEYREAHDISLLNDRNSATTEQLRQAMVHYRALFTDLLEDGDDVPPQEGGYAEDEQPVRTADKPTRRR